MLGVGKCWEILLESDGNTPFIPICRAEPGPKCFVPKSSAEMMSPYFWVMAMTVVPEKLMSYAVLSSCGCPCLNLVDAVIGHSFFSVPRPSPSQPLLQPVTPHCFSSTVAFLSTLHSHHLVLCLCLRRQREKVSAFTPAIHFTSVCLPENLCSVPTCTCHRVKRAVILELPNS